MTASPSGRLNPPPLQGPGGCCEPQGELQWAACYHSWTARLHAQQEPNIAGLHFRMQVDNATAHLVVLHVQLIGLSGNATVLTSKAPGEGGQRGWQGPWCSGMARASGIHAAPLTTCCIKFHAPPIANIASSPPLHSADPSAAPPERQRLGRRSNRVSHHLAAPPGGQHCAIGQQRQAHA